MTQDFAKKKRKPQQKKTTSKRRTNTRRKPNNTNKAPAWAWLVIGLLLAALVTLLIYLANKPDAVVQHSQNTGDKQTAKPVENKPPQPRFDFYEILKEQEVEVPDRSAEIKAATPANIHYYLQAGSFRNRNDADELRAQLLLVNMNANIESKENNGKTWHRVIAGPFKSRSKMAKARSQLASKGLSPLLLKRKID